VPVPGVYGVNSERQTAFPGLLEFVKTPLTEKAASMNFNPFGERRGSFAGSVGSRKQTVILTELNAASAPVVWLTKTGMGFGGWPASAALRVQTASGTTPGVQRFACAVQFVGFSTLTWPDSGITFLLRSRTWTSAMTSPIVVPTACVSVAL
jgi:hypothetical protein